MATLTKTPKVHAEDLHFEHNLWLNQLGFYKQELTIFQKRLDQVAARNNSEEFRRGLSHLQNQVTIQNEQADIHLHDLGESERDLQQVIRENPVAFAHRLFEDHTNERERMATFVRIYDDFKKELNAFLSRWM
jgi:hypothetical protein